MATVRMMRTTIVYTTEHVHNNFKLLTNRRVLGTPQQQAGFRKRPNTICPSQRDFEEMVLRSLESGCPAVEGSVRILRTSKSVHRPTAALLIYRWPIMCQRPILCQNKNTCFCRANLVFFDIFLTENTHFPTWNVHLYGHFSTQKTLQESCICIKEK